VQIITEPFSTVPSEFRITRVADPDPHGSALFLEAGSGSALEWKAGTGSALKAKFRSFRSKKLSRGGPWNVHN
jgi:hypothetical protein